MECAECTASDLECTALCPNDLEEECMVLHTQYRVHLRDVGTDAWHVLVTDDRQESAREEFEYLCEAHGRRNVKLVAEMKYCEPADFLR